MSSVALHQDVLGVDQKRGGFACTNCHVEALYLSRGMALFESGIGFVPIVVMTERESGETFEKDGRRGLKVENGYQMWGVRDFTRYHGW